MNMSIGNQTPYDKSIASQIGELQGGVERLMPQLRQHCLELVVRSMSGEPTTEQIVDRADAFVQYIREGKGDG